MQINEIIAEFQTPSNDASLQQMLKVKQLIGPVTSFWFEYVLPSLENVANKEEFEFLLKYAKHDCEEAVHKNSETKPLGEKLFRVRKKSVLEQLAKSNRAAEIIAKYHEHLKWFSRTRATKIRNFTKQHLLPLIKNWKQAREKEIRRVINRIADMARNINAEDDGKIVVPNIVDVENKELEVDNEDKELNISNSTSMIQAAGVFDIIGKNKVRIIQGEPKAVAECFNYPKSVIKMLEKPRGMLVPAIGNFFVRVKKDSINDQNLSKQSQAGRVQVSEGTFDEVDMASFSSVNDPLTVLTMKSPELRRHKLEYLLNPFAHFTELKRSSATMVFAHKTVQKGRKPVRLYVELDGKIRPEIPLVQATVLMLDESDRKTDEFLKYLTGVEVSLVGDGFVVDKSLDESIGKKPQDVYKLQAPGRAKGIKIAGFDELFVSHRDKDVQVDLIQNLQGKRKNKLACIVSACLRYYSMRTGEKIVIKATEPLDEELIRNVLEYCRVKVPYYIGDELRFVEGYLGIQKLFIDDSADYSTRLGPVAVDYAQFVFLQEHFGLKEKFDRLPKNKEMQALAARAKKWIEAMQKIINNLYVQNPEPKYIPPKERKDWLKSVAEDETSRLIIDAVFDQDIGQLKWASNETLQITWKQNKFELRMLSLLVELNGEIRPSDFAFAVKYFLDAYVSYVNNPTKSRHWFVIQIAKVVKAAASEAGRAIISPRGTAIVGRHATSSRTDDVVIVPEKVLRQVKAIAKNTGQMKDDEWYLIRHPVVAIPPKVKVQPDDVQTILAPRHLAKYIDGDDDGDIISVVPV